MLEAFPILLLTELRSLLRARVTIFWTLLFPFVFLLMMILSFGQRGGMGSTTIEVVDQDRSPASASYVERITQVFRSGDPVYANVIAGNPAVPLGTGHIRLTIPAGFAQATEQGTEAPVTLLYHYTETVEAIAFKVLTAVTIRFNAALAKAPMPVTVQSVDAGGLPPVDFPQYMLTGILIMSMMSSGMNSTCVGIAERRERNNFKMMSCLPLGPAAYLMAMLAARVILLLTASFVLLFGAHWLFGIAVDLEPVRLARAAVVIVLGACMLLALGIALSSRVSSVPNAIFLCNIVYILLLFLTNLTMPINAFPDGMRAVLANLPTAQFAEALRGVLVQGVGFKQAVAPMAVMAGWTVLFLGVGRIAFHWHRA
jgi:ABC-2 type transport system permease protein